MEFIEKLSNASRLFADLHFLQLSTRRALILQNYKNTITQKTLQSLERDEGFLFGSDLGEKVKNIKTMEKTGLELKTPIKKFTANKNLNFKSPPTRKQVARLSGQRNSSYYKPNPRKISSTHHQRYTRSNSSTQYPQSRSQTQYQSQKRTY